MGYAHGMHGHGWQHGRPPLDPFLLKQFLMRTWPGGQGGRGWGGPWGEWGPPPGGRGYGRRGGGRARRGDVRTAILVLLAEEPRNGYQLMQEIEHRSDGLWRPSPGSVYPALAQLEDEGLVRAEESDGRRLFALTDAGRAAVADRGEDQPPPWEEFKSTQDPAQGGHRELMDLMRQLGMAGIQLAGVGNEQQIDAANEVLADARRRLYAILAEDETR